VVVRRNMERRLSAEHQKIAKDESKLADVP
jgi:hypothetical protein